MASNGQNLQSFIDETYSKFPTYSTPLCRCRTPKQWLELAIENVLPLNRALCKVRREQYLFQYLNWIFKANFISWSLEPKPIRVHLRKYHEKFFKNYRIRFEQKLSSQFLSSLRNAYKNLWMGGFLPTLPLSEKLELSSPDFVLCDSQYLISDEMNAHCASSHQQCHMPPWLHSFILSQFYELDKNKQLPSCNCNTNKERLTTAIKLLVLLQYRLQRYGFIGELRRFLTFWIGNFTSTSTSTTNISIRKQIQRIFVTTYCRNMHFNLSEKDKIELTMISREACKQMWMGGFISYQCRQKFQEIEDDNFVSWADII